MNQPPIVLHVYHGEASSVGGAPTSLFYLLQALDRTRYASLLLCHQRGGPHSRFDQLGLPMLYHRLPRFMHVLGDHATLFSWRKWPHLIMSFVPDRELAAIIREHKISVAHLHSAVQVSSALTARRAGVPVVWHIREVIHPGWLGLRRKLFETVIRRWATAIVCISEDEAQPFADLPQTHVVYNTIDMAAVDGALTEGATRRAELGLGPEVCVVGMVGVLARAKGIYDVVEAAQQVVAQATVPVRFLMVGPSRPTERSGRTLTDRLANRLGVRQVDGRTEMEALLREKNLLDYFVFTGPQPNALSYMAAMDVVLFPSHMDALGRPAFEASALGRPVIAAATRSRSGLIKSGETGLLVPPRNPARLADAILSLVNQPAERQRLGQTGYTYARQNFDSHLNGQRIMAIYDEVLKTA